MHSIFSRACLSAHVLFRPFPQAARFASALPLTFAASLCMLFPLTVSAQAPSNPTYTVTVLTDTTAGVAANCTNQTLPSASLDGQCSLRDALTAAAAINGVSGT